MEIDRRTALQALFKLSVDTNLEFVRDATEAGPLFKVMVLARHDAIEALVGLVKHDPTDTKGVMLLQNEVQRFIDLLGRVHDIFRAGDEAAAELQTEEADEVRRLADDEGYGTGEDE